MQLPLIEGTEEDKIISEIMKTLSGYKKVKLKHQFSAINRTFDEKLIKCVQIAFIFKDLVKICFNLLQSRCALWKGFNLWNIITQQWRINTINPLKYRQNQKLKPSNCVINLLVVIENIYNIFSQRSTVQNVKFKWFQ